MGYIRRLIGRRRIGYTIFSMAMIIFSIYSIHTALDHVKPPGFGGEDNIMIMLSDSKLQKEYIDKKGVHVIVGQYNGKSLPWLESGNLSEEILNSNNYDPIPKVGENGMPVYIGLHEEAKMKMLYQINKFNLLASDRISVKRSLPDPRRKRCRDIVYPRSSLRDSSIIIVFHNEAWSTLLRTIHSVIQTTPRNILKEIILVDDASTRKFLGKPLEDYLRKLNDTVTIKLQRSHERIGLIKARLIGARVASGKVLTFLDAHVETTIGWLEPLLYRIGTDRTKVVCPVIDIIHDETFAFARSFEFHTGGINWNFHFRWYPLALSEIERAKKVGENEIAPFRTPIMAGGLFAIDRDYFYEIGSYDEYMDIWGSENIEMSLRIWACGGSLEIVPCSHVAHLFRKSSPYSFPRKEGVAGVLYTNLARVIHVWLDQDWINFFYKINPAARKIIYRDEPNPDFRAPLSILTNLTERIELKQRLRCQNFSWFLDNVWPTHFFPTRSRFFGKILNIKREKCLQRPSGQEGGSSTAVGQVTLDKCAIEMYGPQLFIYVPESGYIMSDEYICLDVINRDTANPPLLMLACSQLGRQRWSYNRKHMSIEHEETGLCLDATEGTKLTIARCNKSPTQRWKMLPVQWYA